MMISIGFLINLDVGYVASDIDNIRSSSKNETKIIQDTTWTLANSPYIITNNISVEENVTLTIQPGVEVKFDGNYYLNVNGTLIANGNKNNMINFTTNNTNPPWWASWQGLRFYNAKNNSIINYCNIEYAGAGIRCTNMIINITNCTFKYNYAYGVCLETCDSILSDNIFINQIINNNKTGKGIYSEYSNTMISDNSFTDFAVGLHHKEGNIKICNNYFYNNKWGILTQFGNIDIYNNLLINNSHGIQTILNIGYKHKIIYNTIKDSFYYAIHSHGAAIIKYNDITNNTIGIQTWYGTTPTPIVHDNNIFNNTEYNINNTDYLELNATNNWWGTTNTSIINAKIFDYHDNNTYGEVIYKPFRTSPFNGTPGTKNDPPIADAGPDQNLPINQTVNFDGWRSWDPDGDTLSYKWNFGDGSSTGWLYSSKTSHSYIKPGNYIVTLTVSDGLLTDTDTCKISIISNGSGNNTAPVAKAGPDQYTKVNQTVNFDGSGSYDIDEDTLTFKWNFGDSSSTGWLTSSKTSHSYNSIGNYTVTLTVSDNSLTDNDTCIIRVSEAGGKNNAPVAKAGPDQNINVNQTVNFDGSGSYDIDGDTLTYKWDFGDSSSTGWLTSSKTSHSYIKQGNYTVILTVSDSLLTDNDSCIIRVFKIGKNNTRPVANAGADQNIKVNQTVNFDGSKSYDPDGDTLSYKWNFGDSSTTKWLSSSKTSHSYYSLGNYTVTLTVSDGSLTDTDTCVIQVNKQQQNTSSPTIISSNIKQGSQNIPINFSKIVIDFSTSMNRSSVESALSISPAINYTIHWGNNDKELQIIFTATLSYNTTYKITIGTTAKDVGGNHLKDPFKLEFTTEIEHKNGKNGDSNFDQLIINLNIYSILIILIITIIILLTLITRNKRKRQEKIENDFSGRHELPGGKIAEDFYYDEEFTKYSNELIKELKKKSLSFKKPSDFKISDDKLLKKLNKQYKNGQLSKTTYDSIKETFNEFK